MDSTPTMTERQERAWPERVDMLNKWGGVDLPVETHHWEFTWREEVRPGRGNDFSATYTDGEHFAQIMLDVYGNGHESVAELTWIHNSSDEECPCGHWQEDDDSG